MSDLGGSVAEAVADAVKEFWKAAGIGGGVAALPGYATGVVLYNQSCAAQGSLGSSLGGPDKPRCVKSLQLLWDATTPKGAGIQTAMLAFVIVAGLFFLIKVALSLLDS